MSKTLSSGNSSAIITVTKPLFSSFYQELLSAKVLVPFSGIIEGANEQDGVRNFTAPSGMNSIVKHFLNSSGEF